MGTNSNIEWTDHTFNPWIGCTNVSPGCDHCYAENYGNRFGIAWGPGAQRRRTGQANWKLPARWNANAEHFAECDGCGRRGDRRTWREDIRKSHPTAITCCPDEKLLPARPRVFCASLADVFDNEVPVDWRADLFELIRATPRLDWLLLTKRIGNAAAMMRASRGYAALDMTVEPPCIVPLPNVWLGATIVNQQEAYRDVPKLLAVDAARRFLSIEPLLETIDLVPYIHCDVGNAIDWVIVGGESGPGARSMDIQWARSVVQQCKAAGVPVFVKQLGAKPEWNDPEPDLSEPPHWTPIKLRDRKGGDKSEWPRDLCIRLAPR